MNDESDRNEPSEAVDPLRAAVLGASTLLLAVIFLSLLVADQASAMAF
ncbi:MAG: hypothetical protein HYX56_00570 [Chloroflexi bacterium]|nr:hypothetical protein [Chloroflexota bacterium]